MRSMLRRKVLLAGACFMSVLSAWGQAPGAKGISSRSLEVAVTFDALHANTVPGSNFWMQGGAIQVAGQITRNWSVAADISGLHTADMPNTGVGLDLITAVFGPRYTMTLPNKRFRIYGQAMGGEANGVNSLFPNPKGATSSANGVALLMGGGLDYPASQRISVRAIDASWLRTALSNGTTTVQNNLRLGSGLAFRF